MAEVSQTTPRVQLRMEQTVAALVNVSANTKNMKAVVSLNLRPPTCREE